MLDEEILVFLPGILDTLINSVVLSGVPDHLQERDRTESQPALTDGGVHAVCV